MAYDSDLTPLLQSCSNEGLDPLVKYLLNAATNTLDSNEQYKANPGNHRAYISPIVSEIRTFGGNSIVNLFRGDGVPYREVLTDVADKLDVDHSKEESVEQIEIKVLTSILEKSLEKMGPEERSALEEEFRRAGAKNVNLRPGLPIGALMAQLGVQMTGFLAYRVAVIVANTVAKIILGRGLGLGLNAALVQVLGVVAGPVGWVISGGWTLVDSAGPAYRVTIPVVCHVAYLRLQQQYGNV